MLNYRCGTVVCGLFVITACSSDFVWAVSTTSSTPQPASPSSCILQTKPVHCTASSNFHNSDYHCGRVYERLPAESDINTTYRSGASAHWATLYGVSQPVIQLSLIYESVQKFSQLCIQQCDGQQFDAFDIFVSKEEGHLMRHLLGGPFPAGTPRLSCYDLGGAVATKHVRLSLNRTAVISGLVAVALGNGACPSIAGPDTRGFVVRPISPPPTPPPPPFTSSEPTTTTTVPAVPITTTAPLQTTDHHSVEKWSKIQNQLIDFERDLHDLRRLVETLQRRWQLVAAVGAGGFIAATAVAVVLRRRLLQHELLLRSRPRVVVGGKDQDEAHRIQRLRFKAA